ncbi:hypothetical protein JCM9534A_20280 [Catenuloplanes indicus JCM 9534]
MRLSHLKFPAIMSLMMALFYRSIPRIVAAISITAAGGLAAGTPAAAHSGQCARRQVTVTLTAEREAPRYRIMTWLCTPKRPTPVVQVLMSGFTYDHHYWTVASPGRRSYVQSALAAGHAVLYIDRIGVGGSDRPPADAVNADTEAHVAHQLVQRLRKDRYRTVVAVGHSYGSLIWAAESYRYDDVDALVLSGYLHGTHVPTQLLIRAHLQQAEGSPPGYLTQAPNFRRRAYLHPPGVTGQMTELDERLRTTGTTGELTSLKNLADPTYTGRIRRPVLLQIGVQDLLFCNPLTGLPCGSPADLCHREKALYPRAPLSATVQRDTGHSILLHRSAQSATATALAWIDHTVRRAPHPRAVLDCR